MTPQRRTALVSVGAACALIGLKLTTGLASGSLGLVSEAVHSGTDLVAALLTFFAVGVAVRPADRSHPYGHGKAEHLAALAEGAVLVLVSIVVATFAVLRLTGVIETEVDAAWWVFVVVIVVIAIDLARTVVSLRSARQYSSAALFSNALHFGSDLAGTVAVLLGLVVAALGWPQGDSVAALFVSFLVVTAAARLMGRNVDVLMDRAPADAVETARRAIREHVPGVSAAPAPAATGCWASLRRCRDRRPTRRGRGAGARGRRRRRGRGAPGARRRPTSSSTSSRSHRRRPRFASVPRKQLCACRTCARCTT